MDLPRGHGQRRETKRSYDVVALEAKAVGDDEEVADIEAAKRELEAATTEMTNNPTARRAQIEQLRAELTLAEEADRAAPAEQAPTPSKKFGVLDGLKIKEHLPDLLLVAPNQA